jgi:transposase-like protein
MWRRLIREHECSGQSVAEFCRERELHASYFFAFRKRLRESAAARFVEVQVAEPRPQTASDSRVELRLRNGRSLMVGRGFDAEHVRALLALAEAAG